MKDGIAILEIKWILIMAAALMSAILWFRATPVLVEPAQVNVVRNAGLKKQQYLMSLFDDVPVFTMGRTSTNTAVTATGPGASTIEVAATRLLIIRSGIGINVHTIYPTTADLQMQQAAGFSYCRIDFSWSSIEAVPGVYNFTPYDRCVNSLKQYGMTPLFILDYSNHLYDGGYSPYDEAGRTAFANFAVAAAKHYQGQGIIWEIYNEPAGFWKFTDGTTGDPGNTASVSNCAVLYAPLAIQVAGAIKNAYPNEIVVAPAVSYCDRKRQPYFDNTSNFLQTCYEEGICLNLNAISVHPYRMTAIQEPEYSGADYATLRSQITNPAYNATGVYPPLISSEWGYTSTTWGTPGHGNYNTTNTWAAAERWKAIYTARSLLSNLANGVNVSIIYDWEEGGTNQSNAEEMYGIVDANDAPLDAYYAIKTFSTQTAGFSYSNFTTNANLDYILEFTNESRTLYVAWSEFGGADVVTIPVGTNVPVVVTSYDNMSVEKYVSGGSGYSCTLNNGPQYITTPAMQRSKSSKGLPLAWSPNGTLLPATNLTGQETNQSSEPLTMTPTNRQMLNRMKR